MPAAAVLLGSHDQNLSACQAPHIYNHRVIFNFPQSALCSATYVAPGAFSIFFLPLLMRYAQPGPSQGS